MAPIDGDRVSRVDLRVEQDHLHLAWRSGVDGGEWKDETETIRIVRAPCPFGGTRPFFICPGKCRRRVTALYFAGRCFRCRRCHDLAYASQNEDAWSRTLRRAFKIRERLGGDPGVASLFPSRPKFMWRRTYERLSEQSFEDERGILEAFLPGSREGGGDNTTARRRELGWRWSLRRRCDRMRKRRRATALQLSASVG